MTNLYWPIYKNIEIELIDLANKIHFDDNQLDVYSVKICELLIRTSVEIEAISKELYIANGGKTDNDREIFFDTDCLKLLNEKWKLDKKKVILASPSFYFQSDSIKSFYPLHKSYKRGESGSNWKKAYQAVKHNRTANLTKGSLKNLISAMGALYILNIYYRGETIAVKENNDNFFKGYSEIFDIKVHRWHGDSIGKDSYMKMADFEECIYLIKWTDESKKKWNEWIFEQEKNLNESIFNHPKVISHIQTNFMDKGNIKTDELLSFIKDRKYFDMIDMKTEYATMIRNAQKKASEKLKYDVMKNNDFEAVLNKGQKVYEE